MRILKMPASLRISAATKAGIAFIIRSPHNIPAVFPLYRKGGAIGQYKGEAMNENDEKHGNDGKHRDEKRQILHNSHTSHDSHSSHTILSPSVPGRLLPPRGDYHTLLSFQKAEIIYDITFRFAHKFLERGDRTVDQMIQSARSGKKNILEGSKASPTSKETEIKLTNVARASLEELLDDYCDYLRARDLPTWDKNSREARYVRQLGCKTPQSYEDYRAFVESRPPNVVANIALCLIHQTNYLLDQQLRRLESDFLRQGGLRERMTRARLSYRDGKNAK